LEPSPASDILAAKDVADHRAQAQGTCGWCGGLATNSSGSSTDAVLDQCETHHKFHSDKLVGLTWTRATCLYHADESDAHELDGACAKYVSGTLKSSPTSEAVHHRLAPTNDTYFKVSILTKDDVQNEVENSLAVFEDTEEKPTAKAVGRMTERIMASTPSQELHIPGTTQKQLYYVFARSAKFKSLYPTLRFGTTASTSKTSSIMDAQDCQFVHDSFVFLCFESFE
jgi:hypothetical protein